MTLRQTTIAKLQELPDPLLQQVSDYIDAIIDAFADDAIIDHNPAAYDQEEIAEGWARWFEEVERLEPAQSSDDYQTLLIDKYRKQGLEL